jgi:hypothetical protein
MERDTDDHNAVVNANIPWTRIEKKPPTGRSFDQWLVVYHLGPIDNWFGWRSLLDVAREGVDEFGNKPPSQDWLLETWLQARDLARRCGWEGDIRGGYDFGNGPWFAPLPIDRGGYKFMIAWKQDTNGSTFVASPIELPWLERSCHLSSTSDDV